MSHLETTLAALKDKFPEALESVVEFRGETTVLIRADANVAVLRFLKETLDTQSYPRFRPDCRIRLLAICSDSRIRGKRPTPTMASAAVDASARRSSAASV